MDQLLLAQRSPLVEAKRERACPSILLPATSSYIQGSRVIGWTINPVPCSLVQEEVTWRSLNYVGSTLDKFYVALFIDDSTSLFRATRSPCRSPVQKPNGISELQWRITIVLLIFQFSESRFCVISSRRI